MPAWRSAGAGSRASAPHVPSPCVATPSHDRESTASGGVPPQRVHPSGPVARSQARRHLLWRATALQCTPQNKQTQRDDRDKNTQDEHLCIAQADNGSVPARRASVRAVSVRRS